MASANSMPPIIPSGLLGLTARELVLPASAIIVGLGGLAVWLVGGTAIHVGASKPAIALPLRTRIRYTRARSGTPARVFCRHE